MKWLRRGHHILYNYIYYLLYFSFLVLSIKLYLQSRNEKTSFICSTKSTFNFIMLLSLQNFNLFNHNVSFQFPNFICAITLGTPRYGTIYMYEQYNSNVVHLIVGRKY